MSATPFPVALRKSFLAPEFSFDSLEAADAAVTGYLERIAPAYAERSVLGLASDWRLFSARCHSAGRAALPAAPETVAAYVDALAATHRPATIRRHLATISHLHRAFGMSNPIDSPEVRLAWRALTRRRALRPVSRRVPLRRSEIEKLLAVLGDTLIDRRDRAILLVARDSLARRSELVQLRVEDITWHAEDGGSRILIRRSKNDPQGEGRLAWLAPKTQAALSAYLEAAALSEGALFRRVFAGRRLGAPLKSQAIARRVKLLAVRAGLDATLISAHSTRIGMTLDLIGSGQSLVAVQLSGGWRSPAMPALYGRQLLPELGAVARYHLGQSGQDAALT